jgi:hypothetical protein
VVVAPDPAAPAPGPPHLPPVSPPQPAATPSPPPSPHPEAPSAPGGLSRTWFFVGLGATAAAGGVTIASGIDAASRHSTFEKLCQSASPAPASCKQDAIDGQSAQTRTNVLIAVTAVLGAATVATALLVRWHDASIALGPGRVSVQARFE